MSTNPLYALMESLTKKDDDAELLQDGGTGQLYVNTTHSVEELAPELLQRDLPPLVDDRLLEDSALAPMMDITVQLIYWLFVAVSIFYLQCGLLGSVPYWVLDLDETRHATVVVTIVSATAFALLYVAMAVKRKSSRTAVVLFILWTFASMVLVGCVSALLHLLAPLQLMTIGWLQALSVVIYAHCSVRYVDATWAAVWMALATAIGWGIGIYAFVVEDDWVASAIILLLGFALVGYNTLQIRAVVENGEYTMSYDDRVEMIIRYFSDPLLWMGGLIYRCCRYLNNSRSPLPPLSENEEEE
jgi:hypothetical protein